MAGRAQGAVSLASEIDVALHVKQVEDARQSNLEEHRPYEALLEKSQDIFRKKDHDYRLLKQQSEDIRVKLSHIGRHPKKDMVDQERVKIKEQPDDSKRGHRGLKNELKNMRRIQEENNLTMDKERARHRDEIAVFLRK